MLEPRLCDTHAHICDPLFDEDRSEVLARAEAAGIGAVVAVGEGLEDARRNMDLAGRHSLLRPAAGLYPTILDPVEAEELHAFIRRQRAGLVAVGEVGLDFWAVKELDERIIQKEIFRSFIELAKELDLPLNVHSRSAGRPAIALLLECSAPKVQLHAFDGKASTAMPAIEAGYFFSIPPSVIRSRQKQKLIKNIPLSQLLVESDSPVLGPRPDQRNEPVNIEISIRSIADIKKVGDAEVRKAVAENTASLYGKIFEP